MLRLFPGITAATVRAFCTAPIRGVILQSYGAGNAPGRPDILEALKAVREPRIVLTHHYAGEVMWCEVV